MVARDRGRTPRGSSSFAATLRGLFDGWRRLLFRPFASAGSNVIQVLKPLIPRAGDVPLAVRSGVHEADHARRLLAAGFLAFAVGAAFSILLASQTGRPSVAMLESVVWLAWLGARLVVMRLIADPQSTPESASITGAWAVGLLPFALAVEYYTSVLLGWLASLLLAWRVASSGPIGRDRSTRAILAALALETGVVIGLAALRNIASIGMLLGGG